MYKGSVLCAGQIYGIEAAVHTFLQSEETEALLLSYTDRQLYIINIPCHRPH